MKILKKGGGGGSREKGGGGNEIHAPCACAIITKQTMFFYEMMRVLALYYTWLGACYGKHNVQS